VWCDESVGHRGPCQHRDDVNWLCFKSATKDESNVEGLFGHA